MIKKIMAMLTTVGLLASLMNGVTFTASAADYVNQSRMLKVYGNKLVWEDDESVEVTLSGVNLPGGEWTGTPSAEKIDRNIEEVMNNWDCNVVRLAVGTKGWNGEYSYQNGNYAGYRDFIRKVITYAEKAGKYVILDLHEYNIFREKQLNFWKEAAVIYKNNPTVLFGVLNEPTPSSWEIWRNGGQDSVGKLIGHQAVVEAIRDTGARNIIVAGGRSYAKDTSGVVNGYALIDTNSNGETNVGNGIMYDTHWYAWHGYTSSWNAQIGPTRMKYPMLMGEFGWDANLNKTLGGKVFNPGDQQYHDKWFTHLMNFFDDYETYDNYMNFTAYSFHPSSAPAMLKSPDANGVNWGNADYAFTTTDYHGVYVKQMLKTRAGNNIALNANIIDQSIGRPTEGTADAKYALDGNNSTNWGCSRTGSRYFVAELDNLYKITKYSARLGGSGGYKNATDFNVYFSKDNVTWVLADSVTGNMAPVIDRYVAPLSAKYIKFEITSVEEASPLATLYDFKAVGEVSDGFDTVEIDAPNGFDVSEIIAAKSQKINYAAGQTADDWTKAGYALVSPGLAEDGIRPALEISGLFGDTQTFGCSGSGTFGNFRDFDGFRFKYSSNKELNFQVELHYRASNKQKFTNTVTLPNTNGEWSTIVITPEELMPTPQDTWVKTDMVTQYSVNYNNFEPVVKLNFSGNNTFDEYARFEYFEAIWLGNADYYPDYMSVGGSIGEGRVKIATRWQNNSGAIEGLFNFICLFDGNGNLVDMEYAKIDLPANTRSQKYYLELMMPSGVDLSDYYIKTYTWRDSKICKPVCESVSISATGDVIYGR
ncbi:MAG: cellulase family glycosylhydrolase [Eubacteriales bacterium]|nr:cellulase family glycosylhydrolase [Eubacteriales bacterium]